MKKQTNQQKKQLAHVAEVVRTLDVQQLALVVGGTGRSGTCPR